MRRSGMFSKLNRFFRLYKSNAPVPSLNRKFLAIIENINSRKGIGNKIVALESIYEACIKFIENEIVNSGFKQNLLSLQRDLYVELEHILSFEEQDQRHHFLIVIPVAERPLMLKNCLDSLLEQCRTFQYGSFSTSKNSPDFYNKVSVFVIDDSRDRSNIRRTKKSPQDQIHPAYAHIMSALKNKPVLYKKCLKISKKIF